MPAISTQPAKGTLSAKSGAPVTGGMIELQPASGSGNRAFGAIQPDGTFELSVMDVAGNRFPGAEVGKYTARYTPVMTAAQSEQPVVIPLPVTITAGANQLDLKLP
ncbi:MAG: hypothetical protein SFU86_08975 [Pirellulaceae bacterium]|nr:hypothetical protein [Pirellulaceae bacterium]